MEQMGQANTGASDIKSPPGTSGGQDDTNRRPNLSAILLEKFSEKRYLSGAMATDEDLCIGDLIYLYSEETRGFLYSFQTSDSHNGVGVGVDQKEEIPSGQCPQALLFQICAQNRYKANKKLPKIRNTANLDHLNLGLRSQVSQAKKAAQAETLDNEVEQKRQLGKPLYYGQIIQAELLPVNGKRAQFKILPRYKVKSEGDLVQVGDLVILESVKSPGQYLHCSRLTFSDTAVYHDSHEINLSVIASGFSVHRYGTVIAENDTKIHAGSVVQFFHKEMEGYIAAEGVFPKLICENVHLRIRPVNSLNHKSLSPPTSAITCWSIERERSSLDGSTINWEEHIRLQHFTTRQYLLIDTDLKVTLTQDRNNPLTVFRLHPVARRGDFVQHKAFLRIQHVLTGFWLHGDRDQPYERMEHNMHNFAESTDRASNPMKRLSWTKKPLRKLTGIETMMYDDAYTILLLPQESVANFNYVAGMVPFLQKLLTEFHHCEEFSPRRMLRVVSGLAELKGFLKRNGVPVKNHQKLLRDFKIVDILVELIRCPSQDARSQDFVKTVHSECYALLRTYLEGFSAKNELYMAKHFNFIEQQLSSRDTSLNAAQMLMELLRDNRSMIDLVTHDQINSFIHLISKNKNYRYLELLKVLCIANGVTLSENQAYIAEKWLFDISLTQNVVDYLSMGKDIGLERDVLYVSTDARNTWISLNAFCDKKSGHNNEEEYLFLEYQLRLFSALCRGRNDSSIYLIAEKGRFIDFGMAFHILKHEEYPDELRAVCAENFRDIFIDIGANYSIMDRVRLVFWFEEVEVPGAGQAGKSRKESVLSGCTPLPFMKQLKAWIRDHP